MHIIQSRFSGRAKLRATMIAVLWPVIEDCVSFD